MLTRLHSSIQEQPLPMTVQATFVEIHFKQIYKSHNLSTTAVCTYTHTSLGARSHPLLTQQFRYLVCDEAGPMHCASIASAMHAVCDLCMYMCLMLGDCQASKPPKIARSIPDPFPHEWVGSGAETIHTQDSHS